MVKVFFSYSHQDEGLRNELEIHLSALKRQGVIETWHDRRIIAGKDIDYEIDREMEHADIILLLVSPYFIASDYCYDVEMNRALDRHSGKDAIVIPVILHPCDWHHTPFGKLRATPTDGKPVSKFPNHHDAFLQITNDIREAANNIMPVDATGNPIPDQDRKTQMKHAPKSSGELYPRSGNLRVRKKFSDLDRSTFISDSFEYIANYFENSLTELRNRVDDLESVFRRIDANSFTAMIYERGDLVSRCKIWFAGDIHTSGEIRYSTSTTDNSWNESLHVEDDEYAIGLKAMGYHHMHQQDRKTLLTKEGGAEMFWSMLIGSLQ